MNLKEMDFEKQVSYLRSLLSSGKNSLLSYFALFAFRHHLAKEYIKKYFNDAKTNLENFAEIGLIEARNGQDNINKEFYLNEALYPALLDVLEEIFGKEYVSSTIASAKFYRDPVAKKTRRLDEDFSEARE